MSKEKWEQIIEFPSYSISNKGRVFNHRTNKVMRTSQTTHGHMKIALMDHRGYRYTRSITMLVAGAFVEPPNSLCDTVVVLDGVLSNVDAFNLAWRPKWFAWRYTHQLKETQPGHYYNLPVFNMENGEGYNSIIEAGMKEGLLFDDIWRSTWSGVEIFPYNYTFEVVERVWS